MALAKQWRALDRKTVARAPERPGYYELGDDDGNVVDSGTGVLRDALKDALAYSRASKVRWTEATSLDHAEQLAAEHE